MKRDSPFSKLLFSFPPQKNPVIWNLTFLFVSCKSKIWDDFATASYPSFIRCFSLLGLRFRWLHVNKIIVGAKFLPAAHNNIVAEESFGLPIDKLFSPIQKLNTSVTGDTLKATELELPLGTRFMDGDGLVFSAQASLPFVFYDVLSISTVDTCWSINEKIMKNLWLAKRCGGKPGEFFWKCYPYGLNID